jgi:IS30 family transposase
LAQYKALTRRHEDHKRASQLQKDPVLQGLVAQWVQNGWSPELISGRLKQRNHGIPVISHEAIYQWIYAHRRSLIKHLVRFHLFRRQRRARPGLKYTLADRVSILQRPEQVNTRNVVGHWETDLLIGKTRSALQVLVERKTRFTHIQKLPNKTAQASYQGLVGVLSVTAPALRLSITYDNGVENALHTEINKKFSMRSYFCQPYHSWEKGTVENTNGLIRRFLPKGTSFDTIAPEQIDRIQLWLNHRPRKCLDFKTPAEAYESLPSVALTP